MRDAQSLRHKERLVRGWRQLLPDVIDCSHLWRELTTPVVTQVT